MKNILITRTHYRDDGTFGVFDDEGVPFALSVELPWKNNAVDVSCIPTGTYICRRIQSPRFGEVFEVTNVPNRTNVLIHKANTINDLKGCIGIGEEFGKIGDLTAVQMSQNGFWEFMKRCSGIDEFRLTIK